MSPRQRRPFPRRTRPAAVLLAATVLLVPTLALMLTRSQTSVFLESRHLIFALPLFQMLVAAGLLRLASLAGRAEAVAVLVGLTALLGVELAWGWHKTPYMYAGEPAVREQAREEAAAWLAATGRPLQRARSRGVDIAYRKPSFAGDSVRIQLRLFEQYGTLGAAGAVEGTDGKPRCYVRVLLGT